MIKLPQSADTDGGDTSGNSLPSSMHDTVSGTGYDRLQQGGRNLSAIEALVRARRDLQAEISSIEREIAADPIAADTNALGSLYEKAVNRIRDEQVKTIPDPSDQDAFVTRFGAHATNRLDALTARLAETLKGKAVTRLNTLLIDIGDALSREEDGDEMDLLVRDGLNAIEAFAEILPIKIRSNLKKVFHRNLAEAEFIRLLDENPHEAMEALNRGAFADMDVNIQDDWKRRARQATTARDRDAQRSKIAARRAEAMAELKKQVALFSDLHRRIETGDAGYADIDAAYANGTGDLSAGLNRRLIEGLDEKSENDKQAADAAERIGGIINSGGDLLPEHDADLELAFETVIGKCHPDMPLDRGRMMLTFAEQTRRLPATYLEPLWRCVIQGPEDKAGDCAGFLHRIGEIDGLDLPVPEDMRPAFDAFTGLLDAGWSPRDAIRKVRSGAME